MTVIAAGFDAPDAETEQAEPTAAVAPPAPASARGRCRRRSSRADFGAGAWSGTLTRLPGTDVERAPASPIHTQTDIRRTPWLPLATSAARDRASVTASRTRTAGPSAVGTPTSSASAQSWARPRSVSMSALPASRQARSLADLTRVALIRRHSRAARTTWCGRLFCACAINLRNGPSRPAAGLAGHRATTRPVAPGPQTLPRAPTSRSAGIPAPGRWPAARAPLPR